MKISFTIFLVSLIAVFIFYNSILKSGSDFNTSKGNTAQQNNINGTITKTDREIMDKARLRSYLRSMKNTEDI